MHSALGGQADQEGVGPPGEGLKYADTTGFPAESKTC
jgi:hypothetical protein